nr:hypothetical protein [Micromonospora sp. DSM 115978]
NLGNFLRHVTADGKVLLDSDDQIVTDTLVTRDGAVVSARVRELLGLGPLGPAETDPVPSPAGS